MDQSKYQSGKGKMMHMMRWSRPDIYNMTQDCARHMMLAGRTHNNAMVSVMDYCMTTSEREYLSHTAIGMELVQITNLTLQ